MPPQNCKESIVIRHSVPRRYASFGLAGSAVLVVGCLLTSLWAIQGCTSNRPDAPVVQATYESPDAAATAFVTALQKQDSRALQVVFGPEVEEMLDSGDPVVDQQRRTKFIAAYKESHELQWQDNAVILCVGEDKWPFPVPIVRDVNAGGWRFDTEAGLDEILSRRIGQNELDVIEVCKAIVDAQAEYASVDRDGDGIAEYAAKFLSDPGTRNGLYWETAAGEQASPLGPLIAGAVEEGYTRNSDNQPQPYHGYCYRMLSGQGASAPGGAMSYLINGQMIAGFAVVAHPAEYGSSGIMTFIVSRDGVVFEKDLGPDTTKLAAEIQAFDPGDGWARSTTEDASKVASGK
jgi:hypothetical protein